MKKEFLIIILLIFNSFLHCYAQKELTIEEAIATALKNNFDIQLAKNDSLAASIDAEYKNAVFLPRINASVGKTFNNNNQKQILADGSKRQKNGIKSNNFNSQLALNWVLFDGLKMFVTRNKLDEFIQLGELNIKNQVINTVAMVTNTYYDIVRQKQLLKAIEEQMSISDERVKLSQYKLDIGVGAKPDVLQGKVDLNAQKALQLKQFTAIEQLKEELNQIMNTQASTVYTVSDSIPFSNELLLGDIQAGIENNNFSLLISKKNISIAGLTLKEIKADRFPTVSLNSAYNYNRTNNKEVINTFSTLLNRINGFNYGVTASIPILNGFAIKRQIRQAQLDIRYQEILYEQKRSELNLTTINAFKEYELQKKALALEEDNILLARENVDIVLQVYRLNSTTLIQLKEAQKSLEDAYTRLITARYNTKLAETELLRLTGDLVK